MGLAGSCGVIITITSKSKMSVKKILRALPTFSTTQSQIHHGRRARKSGYNGKVVFSVLKTENV